MPGPQTQHKGTVYGDDTYLLTYLQVVLGDGPVAVAVEQVEGGDDARLLGLARVRMRA